MKPLAILALLAALTGCATEHLSAVAVIPQPLEKPTKVAPSLMQNIEAAAARTASNLSASYKDSKIAVATFVSVDALEKGEGLGRILAEVTAGQLVKEGLSLTELKTRKDVAVVNGEGEFILTRQAKHLLSSNSVDIVVSGVYAHVGGNTIVSIKALNTKTGAVVAAEGFTVPSNLTQQSTRETHK